MFKKNNPINDFDKLKKNHYQVILADPPWDFATYSNKGKGRSAQQHYNVLDTNNLQSLPVLSLAADRAVLFLWVTDPHLKDGITLMEQWGFEYKTVAFHWSKICKNKDSMHIGLGYYTRANSEICLLGVPTDGKPPVRKKKNVRRTIISYDESAIDLNDKLEYFSGNVCSSVAILSRIREHSKKPDEQYDRIEALFDGPYCELFARNNRSGWDAWGDQV